MTEIRLDGACILVADDQPANVLLLERMLGRVGARVCSTTDPRGVAELYVAERPDLVLLDLHMPGMDGIAVMAALRELIDEDFVPVVILTADSTAPARELALEAGVTDFLTKPFDRTEVLLRVRNLLHARRLHVGMREHGLALEAELSLRRASDDEEHMRHAERTARVSEVLAAGGPRMVFQPVVDLATGRTVSYEALARFDAEPSRTPDLWFAEAAEVGLGEALELSAVANALQHLDRVPWPLPIGVNVSPSTAVSDGLAELLAGVPGERVVLEITEHVPVLDYDALLGVLARFRASGVEVAVDDAGAGFAGLNHILRLRPDVIKLDISLTRDIDLDAVKRALAAALVSFAGEIGSRIVAEGVEREGELTALRRLGIDAGQGYHLARPAPLHELLRPFAHQA